MKFNLWFLSITFPLMFAWMLNVPIALVFTLFLFGVATSVRWIARKLNRSSSRAVQSRV